MDTESAYSSATDHRTVVSLPARLQDAPLDKTDLKILRRLQSAPDISVTKLAEEVGLSHTPCWRRLKRLERDGIILSRVTILNGPYLGFKVNVLASLRLRVHDEETLEEFERAANSCPQIVECFSVCGDSDYVLRVIVRGIDEYESFLKKVLLHLPGVASVTSIPALKSVKVTTMLPL